MDPNSLFGIQFTLSFIAYALLLRWYVAPRLSALPLESALIPLVWVHVFRNIGLSALAPGALDPDLPSSFAAGIAFGDLAAAILALLSVLALHFRLKGALVLVWIFNIAGTVDLVNAFIQGVRLNAFSHPLGANWLIVSMYVPALWVTSIMIFYLLIKGRRATASPKGNADR